MKKYFKIIIIIIMSIVLFVLVYQIISKINHKNEIAQNIKRIPQFSYQSIQGRIFTNQNLKAETPAIFIYFNTECEYCNEEAQMIHENLKKFENVQIIFISFENTKQIKKFAQNHQLINHDNVHFLHDSKNTFASTFDINSLPCLLMYDRNQNLIEKVKGQTKPEILIKKLNTE